MNADEEYLLKWLADQGDGKARRYLLHLHYAQVARLLLSANWIGEDDPRGGGAEDLPQIADLGDLTWSVAVVASQLRQEYGGEASARETQTRGTGVAAASDDLDILNEEELDQLIGNLQATIDEILNGDELDRLAANLRGHIDEILGGSLGDFGES